MNATLQAPWLKKLPAWMYKAGAQAWIDKEYPRHLFIETTSACDLTCSFCPREARKDHMDFGMFQAIIDEASHFGRRSFSLHLFGEPLLYPRWRQAVAYIKSKNQKHTVLLTTNGTSLNAVVNSVTSSDIDLMLWSWRPEAKFTPETKEKLRKWGKFRIRFISEVTPKEAYAEWADWPNVEGRQLHNYGGNIDISTLSGNGWNLTASEGMKDTTITQSRWPCYHLWLAPAVAWNGNILMCCADPHHKEVLGHFPEDTVASVWQGERLQKIRESHLNGKFTGICQTCDVWKQYPDLFFSWQKH